MMVSQIRGYSLLIILFLVASCAPSERAPQQAEAAALEMLDITLDSYTRAYPHLDYDEEDIKIKRAKSVRRARPRVWESWCIAIDFSLKDVSSGKKTKGTIVYLLFGRLDYWEAESILAPVSSTDLGYDYEPSWDLCLQK